MTLKEAITEYNLLVQNSNEELDEDTKAELLPMIVQLLKSNTEEEIPELEFINNFGQVQIKA